jgi:hypothetical protein
MSAMGSMMVISNDLCLATQKYLVRASPLGQLKG